MLASSCTSGGVCSEASVEAIHRETRESILSSVVYCKPPQSPHEPLRCHRALSICTSDTCRLLLQSGSTPCPRKPTRCQKVPDQEVIRVTQHSSMTPPRLTFDLQIRHADACFEGESMQGAWQSQACHAQKWIVPQQGVASPAKEGLTFQDAAKQTKGGLLLSGGGARADCLWWDHVS